MLGMDCSEKPLLAKKQEFTVRVRFLSNLSISRIPKNMNVNEGKFYGLKELLSYSCIFMSLILEGQ